VQGKHSGRDAYELKPVGIGILLDVSWQVFAGHPIRYKLEPGRDFDPQEGEDIWVV
jgi:hypothetical protein